MTAPDPAQRNAFLGGPANALALLYALMIVGTAGAYGVAYAGHSIVGFFGSRSAWP